MVEPKPLTEDEISARVREQKSDIYMRREFLYLDRPTQQKIVDVLKGMSELIYDEVKCGAHNYFFEQISKGEKERKKDPYISWFDVRLQILHFCFGDSDMDGYILAERRVDQAITIFQSLMELDVIKEDF